MLKETKYKNSDQTSATCFQRAYDTKLPFFLYLQQDSEKIRYFQEGLSTFESPTSWTNAVPLTEKLQGSDENAPLFVDIGGGYGSQCAVFRKATQLPGRVICQDLPETVASAPKHEGVEMMAQSFLEKNHIQGLYVWKPNKKCSDSFKVPEFTTSGTVFMILRTKRPNRFYNISKMLWHRTRSCSLIKESFQGRAHR
jgi:hypothetical protein